MKAGRVTTLAMGALALPALAGCQSLGSDLSDFAKGIFPPTPAEAARMAVDPNDPDNRREGTTLLANSPFGGEDAYLKLYREYTNESTDPLVRAAGIRALARHGTAEDALLIAAQLEHENEQVRWAAAEGLQRLHNPEVIPELLKSLRSSTETAKVREAVAVALGQYREDLVFQGLVAAIDARELAINAAALGSLEQLTGQTLGPDPRTWLKWYDQADDPFANAEEYVYPTFSRPDTFMEKVAFWSDRYEETPATPTGLETTPARRTYEDSDTPVDTDAE